MYLCAYDWPQGGTKQVAYINGGGGSSPNSGGHIQELFVGVGGQWQWADLTTITGAPLAGNISRIAGYAWPGGNTKQVVFSDHNAHIIELFVGVGGQWQWADLAQITGAPLAGGSSPGSAYAWSAENTKQVVYIDQNGHLIELYVFAGGQWQWADLTQITGAPPNNGTSIIGYEWPAENTKQVVYIDQNGHLIELYVFAGGQWQWADLTQITGAPPANRGDLGPTLTAYAWSAENTKQVVYIDQNGHIVELYVFAGGQWQWADLTQITGAPVGFAGGIAGYEWPAENTKQVVYIDQNGHLIELYVFAGGQWQWADLTQITGAPVREPEGENIVGYAWSAENTKQVVYIGEHDRLIELYVFVGGQWQWADLTQITGATLGL